MNNLAATFMENLIFVLEFLGLVAAMVIIAYVVEKLEKKKNGVKERTLTTRKIAMIGVFSAIAAVLHVMDFPIPFAPDFYRSICVRPGSRRHDRILQDCPEAVIQRNLHRLRRRSGKLYYWLHLPASRFDHLPVPEEQEKCGDRMCCGNFGDDHIRNGL